MSYLFSMQWVAPIAMNIIRNMTAGHSEMTHQIPDSMAWRPPIPKETSRVTFQMGLNSSMMLTHRPDRPGTGGAR